MRRSRRTLRPELASIAALLVATTGAAYVWVLYVVLPAWITTHTNVEGVEKPPAPASTAPFARRVTFVMLDGLGFEAARSLDELAALREDGAFRELVSHYPTYTSPNITAMMTGLGPRESGVRLNGKEIGVTDVDDVAHAVMDAGVTVRVRGRTYPEFDALTRGAPQADIERGRLRLLYDWVLDAHERGIADTKPPLLELIYFGDVDDAGHEHGADSAQYAEASRLGAKFIRRVSLELDPERDLLVVVSDHSHLPGGGHGGAEEGVAHAFLLAWGKGVRRGTELGPRPIRDVASTLTLVLGARTPVTNTGAPMIDLFDPESRVWERVREPFEQATTYGCAIERTPACDEVDAARLALGTEDAANDAAALIDRLADERETAASARENAARRTRLAAGIAVCALFFALARFRRYAWPWGDTPSAKRWLASNALGPAILAGAYVIVLVLIGYRPTLSSMRQAEVFFVDAAKAGGVAAVFTALVGRALDFQFRDAAFLIVATFGLLVPLWAYVGADPREVGPPVASALVFMLTPLVPAAGLAALLTLLVRKRARTS